ncbi:hypothetical protein KNP414_01348 [Paenibacillus mucilaginosus KNP414]|uniref:Uncharacterized protein n=1 Tax=Paenibacillus mucilaginosus (strain KNP414) TaxID=1036673 RepID=F8FJE9_PAEMK|nr:hypothetical protein KNP414_01348 [Paenibacillus mucilaginosus KNP414]
MYFFISEDFNPYSSIIKCNFVMNFLATVSILEYVIYNKYDYF